MLLGLYSESVSYTHLDVYKRQLLQSSLFLRLLGEKGVNALERLMGLILVMMATQMFLDGIRMWMKG